jgi:hypothetical protein
VDVAKYPETPAGMKNSRQEKEGDQINPEWDEDDG